MSKGRKSVLQEEVTTNEEWNHLLQKTNGLLVVDVYSEWCGPCEAMIPTLRKLKMELGGELLNYAIACSDNISVLERFHRKSEATWIFIENGKMVNISFGADCPKLKKLITKEIKRVQMGDDPDWQLDVEEPAPQEQEKLLKIKRETELMEAERISKEKAEKEFEYRAFLNQMMIELSEETGLILLPWVFYDGNSSFKDKNKSPIYSELVYQIFQDKFDLMEQVMVQLDEQMIYKIFNESGLIIDDYLIAGLIEGKCLALRLRGKIPPADWPVPYPFVNTTDKIGPTRAIDDIEHFLKFILEESSHKESISSSLNNNPGGPMSTPENQNKSLSFVQKHKLILYISQDKGSSIKDQDQHQELVTSETDVEINNRDHEHQTMDDTNHVEYELSKNYQENYSSEDHLQQYDEELDTDVIRKSSENHSENQPGELVEYPAVWYPPNARNKVHLFTTLFTSYMDIHHPYKKPTKPPPLCAFKFAINKLSIITDLYQQFNEFIQYFGIFNVNYSIPKKLTSNPLHFNSKSTLFQGKEIILIVIKRINENIFLSFAGSYPIDIDEDQERVKEIIDLYFHQNLDQGDEVSQESYDEVGGDESEEEEEEEEGDDDDDDDEAEESYSQEAEEEEEEEGESDQHEN